MNWILVLPILIPLATASISMLFWRSRFIQRAIAVVGGIALFVSSIALFVSVYNDGIQAVQMGNWVAPFGITLVADLLSAAMVVVTGFMGLSVILYSLGSVDHAREAYGYYPLMHVLLMGVCGTFLTGDMFNLYVWFEVMLIASFVLLALGGERPQLEGAIKYVAINLVSSAFFLMAVGLLYGVAGTLNMADLSLKLHGVSDPGLVEAIAMMFLVSFGIKAAIFPLFFWLPASYHTPPIAVTAIFAALLTKVGVYSIIRVFTLIFVQDVGYTHRIILVLAGLTMITGVLGAVAQNEVRRILSFHIVSQIGYMLMGLGLFTPLALAASSFYIVHHIVTKTALFLAAGIMRRYGGSYDLKYLGGLYRTYPGVALLFLIPAMSLAGVPPLSGFFAKLGLIRAGLEIQEYPIVGVAVVVGVLTMYSMSKIWHEAFWKAKPATSGEYGAADPAVAWPAKIQMPLMVAPAVAMIVVIIGFGLVAGPLYDVAQDAAQQLMNPDQYVAAVLGT
jgi:multicomponent Na+:H+ antiporter subunit D